MKILTTILALVVLVLACSEKSERSIPPASGGPGDMYLIMDSAQWKGKLGDVVDSIFNHQMRGLPRKESIFRARWIDPRKLNFVLRQGRNLVFVMTLDGTGTGARQIRGLFTPESIQKIKSEPTVFNRATKNVHAKNQEVMYLFGATEEALIKNLRENGSRLVDHFDQSERARLTASLFKAGRLKGVTEILQNKFQCELKVPFGYQLVQDEADFLWVRQINPKDDKDIFIARKKYISQKQFSYDSLLAFRNDVCRKYIFEDPERSDTYLVTETENREVLVEQTNFRNQFAMEMRGLWRTNNLTMGGPFLSYTLVDEGTGMLYYIEGFTFSPGRSQREIMRELETILHTFRTSKDLTPQKK